MINSKVLNLGMVKIGEKITSTSTRTLKTGRQWEADENLAIRTDYYLNVTPILQRRMRYLLHHSIHFMQGCLPQNGSVAIFCYSISEH